MRRGREVGFLVCMGVRTEFELLGFDFLVLGSGAAFWWRSWRTGLDSAFQNLMGRGLIDPGSFGISLYI